MGRTIFYPLDSKTPSPAPSLSILQRTYSLIVQRHIISVIYSVGASMIGNKFR